MLNDSGSMTYGESGEEDNALNISSRSGIEKQENNPKKLRSFYQEYCHAIHSNKRPMTGSKQGEEVDLLDILIDLGFISKQENPYSSSRAVSSEIIEK